MSVVAEPELNAPPESAWNHVMQHYQELQITEQFGPRTMLSTIVVMFAPFLIILIFYITRVHL